MTGGGVAERIAGMLRHRLVGDTLLLSAGQVIAIGAQAVTSIVAARVLGPDQFGAYVLVAAFVTAVGLLDLTGSNRVALIEIAKAEGAGETRGITDALAAWLALNVTVNAVIVTLIAVTAPFVTVWIYGRDDIGSWARWFCLPAILDVPFDLLALHLQARRRMTELVRFETARAILVAVLSMIGVIAGHGVAGLVAARVVGSLVASAVAVVAHVRLAREDAALPSWPTLLARTRHVSLRSRAGFGVALAVEKNLGNFGGQLPLLMLGALDRAAVGYFSAALRVVSLPYPFVSALARNLDSALPFAAAEGRASLRSTFVRSTIGSAAIWSVVTIGTAVLAPYIITRVLGADYAPALPAAYVLLIQSLAVGAGVGIGATLRSTGRVGELILLQAATIALTVVPGYLLLRDYGATGAAWFHSLRYVVLTVAGLALSYRAIRAEGAGTSRGD